MSFFTSVLNLGFVPYPDTDTETLTGAFVEPSEQRYAPISKTSEPTAAVDSDQAHVLHQIGALATARNGDRSTASLRALFDEYDSGTKGRLDKSDITRLLDDAGVCVKKFGFRVPQGLVADKILDAVDKDADRCVSWDEYLIATAYPVNGNADAMRADDVPTTKSNDVQPAPTNGARVSGAGTRVGSVTSASEAVNKLNKYVVDVSPRHDLSTESWRAVWKGRFGSVDSQVNQGGISQLLEDIDACAPGYAGGCDGTAVKVFEGMNKELGLAADNGWMSVDQMLAWLGRSPVNADDPPGEGTKATEPAIPEDPDVISADDRNAAAVTDDWISSQCAMPIWAILGEGGKAACRASFEDRRAAAIAKIARIEGSGGMFSGFTVRPGFAIPGDSLTIAKPSTTIAKPSTSGWAGLSTRWKVGLGLAAATGLYLAFRHKDPIR